MRNRILHTWFLAALLSSGALAAEEKPDEKAAATVSGDTTVATINGEAIPLEMFRMYYADRLRQPNAKNTPELQNQAFNELINLVATAQDAESKGLDKEDSVRYFLALQRLQVLSRASLQNAAKAIQPTEEELKKAYEERVSKDKRTEYKARHILVKTEDQAKELITKLDGGADFAELAKEKSLGPTGKEGGELGWFGPGQMVPPFTEAVAAMKPGNHSSKPVQTQFGWHVILLEDSRESDPPSLDEVKDELTAVIQRETLAKYVASLRESATVDLNSDLIKMSEPPAAPAAAK
jgi:peptidyl-prolyl cis-trans isomerase C